MNDKINTIELRLQWQQQWDSARRIWSPFVKLREPVWCLDSRSARAEGLTGSFAMIRLTDHRIVIDLERVRELDVSDCALQVLAHEIGHHIYTPANLHDNAILLARIRWGLPGIEDRTGFVANIYADLLINDFLQRSKNLDMVRVYQKMNQDTTFSRLWALIMRTYEYLWKLKRGTLLTDAAQHSAELDADAAIAASLIRSYAKNWLDGAGRFTVLVYTYLMEDEAYQKARASFLVQLDSEYAGKHGGLVSGITQVDEDTIKGTVDPRREALGAQQEPYNIPGAFGTATQETVGPQQRYLSPGYYIDLLRQVNPEANEQDLLNNYYKEIALPHLVEFPLEQVRPVAYELPEGLENWDIGDSLEEIDWLGSAIYSPEIIPGYSTMKRIYSADDSSLSMEGVLDVYLGIDCSGSMNNPRQTFSWPVLAATIIALSALRAGAKVMACLSGEPGSFLETEGYQVSEKEVLTVLTSYLGTGYAFGIPRLKNPFANPIKAKSHLILVTDDDIFSMLDADTETKESNWDLMEKALTNAGGKGTLVLHAKPAWHKEEVIRLKNMGWQVYYVTNEQELLDFAAGFSTANYKQKER